MARQKRTAAFRDYQQRIGRRLQLVRKLVVPNAAEFARSLHLDPSMISKIESGDRPPSVFDVVVIGRRLGVTPNYILEGDLTGIEPDLLRRLQAGDFLGELAALSESSRMDFRGPGEGHGADDAPPKRSRKARDPA